MILRYDRFVSESLLGKVAIKTKEVFNRRQISENDRIGDKWISRIMDDWMRKKDPLKISLRDNGSYVQFVYVISDEPSVTTGAANREDGDIDVEITLLRENWGNDISGARIGATIFREYRGNLNLFGRSMKDNKIVQDDKGIREDVYDYINISRSKAVECVKTISDEILKKYPKIDRKRITPSHLSNLYDGLYQKHRRDLAEKRRKDESEYGPKQMKIKSDILSKTKIGPDELGDMIYELEDDFGYELKILNSEVSDGIMDIVTKTDNPVNVQKFNNRNCIPDGIYYLVSVSSTDRLSDSDSDKTNQYFKNNRRIRSHFDYLGRASDVFKDFIVPYSIESEKSFYFILRQK